MTQPVSEARVDNPSWPTTISIGMASGIVGWVVSQISVGRRLDTITAKLEDVRQRVAMIEGKMAK